MYAAKNGAESCVAYRSDIDLNDPSLLSLMGELREAIAAGQVDIEVEPVMDLLTDRIQATEALVRWHHPVRGTLRPGLFLPLAERNGLIVPLTALVLDRAVAACAAWRADGLDIGISVNLSARSLLDVLAQTVADVLDRWGLPSDRPLEITESIVLSDADRALGLLAELRGLGVRLSLDDFGTGYSSLTHLSEAAHPAAEDRPVVRQPGARLAAGPGDRGRRGRPGTPPGPRGGGRGHREAGDRRAAGRAGLCLRTGPPLRAVDVAGAPCHSGSGPVSPAGSPALPSARPGRSRCAPCTDPSRDPGFRTSRGPASVMIVRGDDTRGTSNTVARLPAPSPVRTRAGTPLTP